MLVKTMSRRTSIVIILTGLAVFLNLFFYFVSKNAVQNDLSRSTEKSVLAAKQSENYGLPVRIKIPRIGVDAAIESVGLTTNGAMEVPNGQNNAAWFSLGPRPGDIGSAVIDGHYGIWKNGKETVFNDLDKLRQGDEISIEEDNGVTVSFVVRETQIYDSKADASKIFTSVDGKSHLNLITCEGTWNQVSKTYPRRLIVFADRMIANL